MRISLKALFALQAGIIAAFAIVLWLRTDTIFYCDRPCELRMPDGTKVIANRWFKRTGNEGFSFLDTTNSNEWHLIQNSDSSRIATVNFNGVWHEVLVTKSVTRGPNYRTEFWIRPGNRVQQPWED